MQTFEQQAVPHVDTEKPDGNPINYQYSMSIFKEVIEYRIEAPTARLIRLIEYTDGESRQLIYSCVQQPTCLSYQNAKMLLEKWYRDTHRMYESYRKEIKNWLPMKYREFLEQMQ